MNDYYREQWHQAPTDPPTETDQVVYPSKRGKWTSLVEKRSGDTWLSSTLAVDPEDYR